MTTLNITLSAALQNQLNKAGTYLDYVGFSKAGGDTAVTPVTNLFTGQNGQPSVTTPLTISIDLPQGAGQKIYFIEASSQLATDPIPGYLGQDLTAPVKVFASQSAITIGAAYTKNYRFDSFEATLSSSSADQANLTSVVGFGLPMSVVVPAQTTVVRGYNTSDTTKTPIDVTLTNAGGSVGYKVDGGTIFSKIQALQPNNNNDITGSLVLDFNQAHLASSSGAVLGNLTGPRYATAPSSASQVVNPPAYPGDPFPVGTTQAFSPGDWTGYLTQLSKTTGSIGKLAGVFNGAADANGIWHNQGFYNYVISSFTSKIDNTAHFLLSPTTNSQIKGFLDISLSNLANSIYSTLGSATIYSTQADALAGTNPYTIYNPSTTTPSSSMNVGANNQWGSIFTQFLTGLSAGYYGGLQGVSPNGAVTSGIDLSPNWNWDPTYAFGGGFPIFGSTSQVTGTPPSWFSDSYSKVFFLNSNSYGSGYSDNLMQKFSVGGPLLTVGMAIPTGQALLPAGALPPDVPNINLTIYADVDPLLSGYTTPQLSSYIAPNSANKQYSTPNFHTSGDSITMNFVLPTVVAGSTSAVLDQSKAQITFKYLDGYTNSNSPIFDAHPLVMNLANSGTLNTLWQQWQIVAPGGDMPAYAGGGTNTNGWYVIAPNGTALPEGAILLLGSLPVVNPHAGNGVGWYQIKVDSTDGLVPAKTFNLYTTTASGGQFVNSLGSQAIDGGASIAMTAGTATAPTFTINFMDGSSTDIDGSLLTKTSTNGGVPAASAVPTQGIPLAPVAGTIANGTFTALTPYGTAETSATPTVAFGWVGLSPGTPANPTYNGSGGLTGNGLASVYSNKISAGDIAYVTVYADPARTGTPVAALKATADIDGQWVTSAVTLPNSAAPYYVFMQEFDAAFTKPVGNVSQALTLNVPASSGTSASAIPPSEHEAATGIVGINPAQDLHA